MDVQGPRPTLAGPEALSKPSGGCRRGGGWAAGAGRAAAAWAGGTSPRGLRGPRRPLLAAAPSLADWPPAHGPERREKAEAPLPETPAENTARPRTRRSAAGGPGARLGRPPDPAALRARVYTVTSANSARGFSAVPMLERRPWEVWVFRHFRCFLGGSVEGS